MRLVHALLNKFEPTGSRNPNVLINLSFIMARSFLLFNHLHEFSLEHFSYPYRIPK